MKLDWNRLLLLGIVHYMVYPQAASGEGPLADSLAELVDDEFFSEIEIAWVKKATERRRVRRVLESRPVTVTYAAGVALLAHGTSLNSFDDGERAAAVTVVKDGIEEALEFGARRVCLVSGPDPGEGARSQAIQLFVEAVQDICCYAQDRDVLILLEPFDRSVDRKALLGPCRDVLEVVTQVRSRVPNFGVMYDQAHMPLLGETAHEALTVLRDCLGHVHLGNCIVRDRSHPYYGDHHPRFGVPGSEFDVPKLAAFIRDLFSIGYLSLGSRAQLPIVAIEVKPMAGEDPQQVLAASKQAWCEAWALV